MAVTCTDHRKGFGSGGLLQATVPKCTFSNRAKQTPASEQHIYRAFRQQGRLLNLVARSCKFSPNISIHTRATVQTVGRQIASAEAWTLSQCSPRGTHGGCIWPGFGCITLMFPCDIIARGGGRTASHYGELTVKDWHWVSSLNCLAAIYGSSFTFKHVQKQPINIWR